METSILLESGTNELEIVEFRIDEQLDDGGLHRSDYAVNVAKVREIIRVPELTEVPDGHPALEGVCTLRDKVIPIVNLPKWLKKNRGSLVPDKVIVMEFNHVTVGVLVHGVSRIHRLSWTDVEPPVQMMEEGAVTSVVRLDNKIIMILDFERIIGEICPETALQDPDSLDLQHNTARASKTVLIAEDSGFIRKNMKASLDHVGYRVVQAEDGQSAYDILCNYKAIGGNITDHVNLVITDVEMPRMDGLHLTTLIKEDPVLQPLPVIIFSSMASEANARKWSSLGAYKIITKPDLDKLVHIVDDATI